MQANENILKNSKSETDIYPASNLHNKMNDVFNKAVQEETIELWHINIGITGV